MLSVIPQAMCSKFPVVLHMDCTFKCNDNEFPILIIGITDACQQFHPLSISIISHHTEDMYEDVLRNFNRLIPHVLTGVTFIPAYGMTDCEPAERYREKLRSQFLKVSYLSPKPIKWTLRDDFALKLTESARDAFGRNAKSLADLRIRRAVGPHRGGDRVIFLSPDHALFHEVSAC